MCISENHNFNKIASVLTIFYNFGPPVATTLLALQKPISANI